MLKDRYSYVAVFSYDEDGICIEFPDLPGCYPCADAGDTDMALKNAKEAMGLHIWGMEQDNEELPRQPLLQTWIWNPTRFLCLLMYLCRPSVNASTVNL